METVIFWVALTFKLPKETGVGLTESIGCVMAVAVAEITTASPSAYVGVTVIVALRSPERLVLKLNVISKVVDSPAPSSTVLFETLNSVSLSLAILAIILPVPALVMVYVLVAFALTVPNAAVSLGVTDSSGALLSIDVAVTS